MAVSLHQLLKTMLEMNGSDLHVTTNSAPQVRVDGRLVTQPGQTGGRAIVLRARIPNPDSARVSFAIRR